MVRKSKERQKQRNRRQPKVNPRGELHEIEWLDAYEESAGWHSIKDALKMRPKTVLSAGYLFWEDKNYTILGGDMDPKLRQILKQAKTVDEVLLLAKKIDLDSSDCGRLTVVPGQWIKNKRQVK